MLDGDDKDHQAIVAAAAAEKAARRSATSQKLDWMRALMIDPAISPHVFEIGTAIMYHVNMRTGVAMVSDETLADETSLSIRHVRRARAELRARGWIEWQRTRTANIYRPLGSKINLSLDLLMIRREARHERRQNRQSRPAIDGSSDDASSAAEGSS